MGLLAFGDTGWGDELFFATLMTIAVAAAAIFIGFFLAAIFASFKLSKIKILNLIGSFYTTVFRGVPELLVIYLFFFGGSGAIMYVAKIKQARKATKNYDWIYGAPVLLKVADNYHTKGEKKKSSTIYAQLASIPLDCPEVNKAKKRLKPE